MVCVSHPHTTSGELILTLAKYQLECSIASDDYNAPALGSGIVAEWINADCVNAVVPRPVIAGELSEALMAFYQFAEF